MKTFRTLAALFFCLQAGFVDSESAIVRSMNQHVLLQVKAKIMLQEGNSSLSKEEFEHFESKSIPLEWILQVDELLFESASSESYEENSMRLDEQILEVQWNSTKREGGWAGTADYSLLLPLETSTRRSNRALRLAVWEMNLETGSRRFLTQQLTHVPKTTPLGGSSDRDYSWKANTVVEMSIKSRHNRNEIVSASTIPDHNNVSYGLWVFIAVSLAGLLHLWNGARPPSREEVHPSAELDTMRDEAEAENNSDAIDEEASVNDFDWDEHSLSPAFVLLRADAQSTDSSDDEESEEQIPSLERPPSMERRLIKSYIDEGVPFVEALDRATEKYIIEQRSRMKASLISIENEEAGAFKNDGVAEDKESGASRNNDGVSAISPGCAKSPNFLSDGGAACSSTSLIVESRPQSQESPGLLKLGDDFASLDMSASPKLQTKIDTVGHQEDSGKDPQVCSPFRCNTDFPSMDHSKEEIICNEQILNNTTAICTGDKRDEAIVSEKNIEESNASATFEPSSGKGSSSEKKCKKRPRELSTSERKECFVFDEVRIYTGSPVESKNTLQDLSSVGFPGSDCKRSKGSSAGREQSDELRSNMTDIGKADQVDAKDGREDAVAATSVDPIRPIEAEGIETTQNDSLSRGSNQPTESLYLGEHDDAAGACVPAVETPNESQFVDGESPNTEADEMTVLKCPDTSVILEPAIFLSPDPDSSESLLAGHIASDQDIKTVSEEMGLSLPVCAPPDSPYTSTLPPDSSSSYSDSSVDSPRKNQLEYAKTILEKSAELRSVAGDDILAEFVPSAALKTAAMAMKDFSFEFEGKGSRAKPLTLKALSDNISKRPARSRSFDSTKTPKSKNLAVLKHRSGQQMVSNIMSPDSTMQGRAVMGENTPALKNIMSPPTTSELVKSVGKKANPPSSMLPINSLAKVSSRKRRMSFKYKEKLIEPNEQMKKLESSHPVDPFDFPDDTERVDPFACKDGTQLRPKKIRAISFR